LTTDLKVKKTHAVENSKWADKFTPEKLALKHIKLRKAAGLDEIYTEFIRYSGPKTIKWLSHFFSDILQSGKLPKLFKQMKISAVLKPGKSKNDVNSCRPISLLSVCYKLMERLIYNRIVSTIDDIIPHEK